MNFMWLLIYKIVKIINILKRMLWKIIIISFSFNMIYIYLNFNLYAFVIVFLNHTHAARGSKFAKNCTISFYLYLAT